MPLSVADVLTKSSEINALRATMADSEVASTT